MFSSSKKKNFAYCPEQLLSTSRNKVKTISKSSRFYSIPFYFLCSTSQILQSCEAVIFLFRGFMRRSNCKKHKFSIIIIFHARRSWSHCQISAIFYFAYFLLIFFSSSDVIWNETRSEYFWNMISTTFVTAVIPKIAQHFTHYSSELFSFPLANLLLQHNNWERFFFIKYLRTSENFI